MLPETAVGKYQRAVFACGKYIFGRVVDGMRQQIDIVALSLYVCDVLYVSFQNGASVFLSFPFKGFQTDIKDLVLKPDAIVYAIFDVTFQISFQPFAEYLAVFGKEVHHVGIQKDFLFLFGTHDSRMSCVVEARVGRVIPPPSDKGGFCISLSSWFLFSSSSFRWLRSVMS